MIRDAFHPIKPFTKPPGSDTGALNSGLYLVRCTLDSRLYIEKRLQACDVQDGHAGREYRALKQVLGHPNIIQVAGGDFNIRIGYGSIWTSYCELGALDMVIDRFYERGEMVPEGFVWRVFVDMACALCFMSTGVDALKVGGRGVRLKEEWNVVYHRDIKPGNIFLTKQNDARHIYPKVVLGDFGCAALRQDIDKGLPGGTATRWCPPFKAPEFPRMGRRSDVYQLGLVIHCLSRRLRVPWERSRMVESPTGSYYSKYLEELVGKCLKRDGRDRPDSADLPALIVKGMEKWMSKGKADTSPLPRWALPSQ